MQKILHYATRYGAIGIPVAFSTVLAVTHLVTPDVSTAISAIAVPIAFMVD